MPLFAPCTDAAVMVIPAPLASLAALIPSPDKPVTVPVTLIEIAPPPELLATMTLSSPTIDWPLADWVKVMPLVVVCVSVNAVPSVSTGVSECTVTFTMWVPLELKGDAAPIWLVPSQRNAPGVPSLLHLLVVNACR